MKIVIAPGPGEPLYEQIKRQIRHALASGTLKPGDQLPSIRSLALDLQISVITTTRAYSDLEKEGLIYSAAGKGFFVRENIEDLLNEHLNTRIQTLVKDLCRLARQLNISPKTLTETIEREMNIDGPSH